jgi:hypothetical protein
MRVKNFADNQNFCKSCGAPNIRVYIYREYFHVFWIPFFPTGNRSATMVCEGCGEPFRHDSIQYQHANNAKRAPFYLYAGLLFIAALVVLIVFLNLATQKEKAAFVADPKVT